jgi:hypothetical protein
LSEEEKPIGKERHPATSGGMAMRFEYTLRGDPATKLANQTEGISETGVL